MKAIYEPKGKAREYCSLAVNLYKGCSHGCLYCYAPSATYRTREDFAEKVEPRYGIIDAIKKEAASYAGQDVHLCFTCDPYQQIEMTAQLTRRAIKALKVAGCNVVILTKGGQRSIVDFDLLTPSDKYGATLTFTSRADSLKWEPGAADPSERIGALMEAHEKGIQTWASLEPVIDPEQSLELIHMTHQYVDVFKVGKWNHDKRAKEIDWKEFAADAVALLEKLGKKYYIKEDLKKFL